MNNINLLLQILQSNPQFNSMINQQKQTGLSMEQSVRQYAKDNNIDLQPILNNPQQFINNMMLRMLSQRGIKF